MIAFVDVAIFKATIIQWNEEFLQIYIRKGF